MDILKGNIKSIYFKYLIAAFGGTLIPCIYSVVDVAMVGKYHGPSGPAALAVFAPLWNIIYGLGLLAGIGGSVLFSTMRGSDEKNVRRSNEIFTASLFLGISFSVILEVFICCSNNKLFLFFGADDLTLSMAQAYLKPIQFVIPLFLLNQLIAAFLRNDGNPGLATIAVLSGGLFNILGDFIFVFPMNMGILGAGLATAIGCAISFLMMMTRFVSCKNTISIAFPQHLLQDIYLIVKMVFQLELPILRREHLLFYSTDRL